MSARIPNVNSYEARPFVVNATTAGVAVPVTEWTAALGDTAILCVSVPADGDSVVLGPSTGAAVDPDDYPDTSICKAKIDTAGSVNLTMVSAPISRSKLGTGGLRLFASGSIAVKAWFLPITEPGD